MGWRENRRCHIRYLLEESSILSAYEKYIGECILSYDSSWISLSNLLRFQESQDGISHLEWEKVRVKFIKAGTLERLVESLTSDDGELESTYFNIFFTTYRTFATPEQVLSLILERYDLWIYILLFRVRILSYFVL